MDASNSPQCHFMRVSKQVSKCAGTGSCGRLLFRASLHNSNVLMAHLVLLLVLAGISPFDSSESCWSLAKSKR